VSGRQGFEPRYHGPESGEWVAVGAGSLCFVRVFGVTPSVRSHFVLLCSRTKCLIVSQALTEDPARQGVRRETQSLAVRINQVGNGLGTADLPDWLGRP